MENKTKDEQIEKLWESSNHGTMREDIVAAFAAGEAEERKRWNDVEQYLVAAADGSMSRNNSEQLAADLLVQIRRP